MRGMTIVSVTTLLVLAGTTLVTIHRVAAQRPNTTVYSPYPSGLIPADLVQETQRVNAEIDRLEEEALRQWKELPITASTQMRQMQLLGKLELYDKTLSVNRNMACSFCHMPYTGFSGPISSLNATTVAYPGSVPYRFGKRKPQGYTYSPYYPVLQYNETQENFYGGNFWDLRATGFKIQSPDSEQAQGPPHDTQEMGLPDTACVVYRLSQSPYRTLFETVWGKQAFAIRWPTNTEQICSTPAGAASLTLGGSGPNNTTLQLPESDRGLANSTYDEYAHAITAYEISPDVSPFTSKFDFALANPEKQVLSADERAGWELFRGKAKCNTCHLDGTDNRSKTNARISAANAANVAPLFTDFTAANLGVPKNPDNPFYYQTTPDAFGFTPNPQGKNFVDLGVGLFLRSQSGINPNDAWTSLAEHFDGFMQVSTLRNVDMRPYPTFVKSYMHNGYLKSLKEVVHFYNTRDVLPRCKGAQDPREKVGCWPAPEVPQNKDMTIGNLGLTDQEEMQIVAFMKTLTDGYTKPYTDFENYGKVSSKSGSQQ